MFNGHTRSIYYIVTSMQVLQQQLAQVFGSIICHDALQVLAQPLQTALKLGLQFPALATVAVAALERREAGQIDDLAKLAPLVVPCLQPYLQDVSQLEAVEPVPDAPAGEHSSRTAL